MRFVLYTTINIAFFTGFAQTVDPFEYFRPGECFIPRVMTGCPTNETLNSAFQKSNYTNGNCSNDDYKPYGNEPNTKAYLFTPCNKEHPEFLHDCGGGLPDNTKCRSGELTVIVIHGWISPICAMAIFREMKYQFLCRIEWINVILVDWSWGSGIDYYTALRNTGIVAKQIAYLMYNIQAQKGPQKFYIVGHSLGAHIAGKIGQILRRCYGIVVFRITGLDPAQPGYSNCDPETCLDSTDAEMVDIIHSNAGDCLTNNTLGKPEPMGHADFYVNDGTHQEGAENKILELFLKGDFYSGFMFMVIGPFYHHFFAVDLLIATILPCDCLYWALVCTLEEYRAGHCNKCGDNGKECSVMGYDWMNYNPKTDYKTYYYKTSKLCPYNNGGRPQNAQQCVVEGRNCFENGKCTVHKCY